MLEKYIENTMKKTRYEILKNDGSFYGVIPA